MTKMESYNVLLSKQTRSDPLYDKMMDDLEYFIKLHESHHLKKPSRFEDILNFLYDKTPLQIEAITIDDDDIQGANYKNGSKVTFSMQLAPSMLFKLEEMVMNWQKYEFVIPDWQPLMHLEYPFCVMSVVGEEMSAKQFTFLKTVEGFKALPEDDRLALVQGGSVELLLLKTMLRLDEKGSCWTIADQKSFKRIVELTHFFRLWGFEFLPRYAEIAKKFKPKWRGDKELMMAVFGILLHNPTRQNLVATEFVR